LVRIGTGSRLVPVPVDGDTDATVVSEVEDPVAAYIEDLDENEIATTEVPLDGREPTVRARESNLGDLMADGLLTTARDRADEFDVEEADVALQNGGGMRSEAIIEPGPVTELDTFDIAAFSNIVSVIELDGDELAAALEHSVSEVPETAGFHGQWAGIEFRFDTDAAAGERITEATVTRADDTEVDLVVNGEVEAGDETFTLASIDFLLGGNDGYDMFEGKDVTTLGRTYQQSLADYFEQLGTVEESDYPDLTVNEDRYWRFGPEDGTFIE
ncbi:MAG: 5'-nucleotidase C-terminal domain-containing protein, partial [Nitriliruptoraceae bacterium]